jgi:predicted small lipoprotein YifL
MVFDIRSALRPAAGIAAMLAVVLLVSACGRRGPLEAPPDGSAASAAGPASPGARATGPGSRRSGATNGNNGTAPAGQPGANGSATGPANLSTQPQAVTLDTPEDQTDPTDPESILPSPTPPPPTGRKRNRGYLVPKEPFILDPLL